MTKDEIGKVMDWGRYSLWPARDKLEDVLKRLPDCISAWKADIKVRIEGAKTQPDVYDPAFTKSYAQFLVRLEKAAKAGKSALGDIAKLEGELQPKKLEKHKDIAAFRTKAGKLLDGARAFEAEVTGIMFGAAALTKIGVVPGGTMAGVTDKYAKDFALHLTNAKIALGRLK